MSDLWAVYQLEGSVRNSRDGERKKAYVGYTNESRFLSRMREHQSGTQKMSRQLFGGAVSKVDYKVLEWEIATEEQAREKEARHTEKCARIYGSNNVYGAHYMGDIGQKALAAAVAHYDDECFECGQTGHKSSVCPTRHPKTEPTGPKRLKRDSPHPMASDPLFAQYSGQNPSICMKSRDLSDLIRYVKARMESSPAKPLAYYKEPAKLVNRWLCSDMDHLERLFEAYPHFRNTFMGAMKNPLEDQSTKEDAHLTQIRQQAGASCVC